MYFVLFDLIIYIPVNNLLLSHCAAPYVLWLPILQTIWTQGAVWSGFIVLVLCLFDLILYIPVNNFSVMPGRVFLWCTSTKQGLMSLAEGHKAVTPARPEPASLDLESSTLSLCTPYVICLYCKLYGPRSDCS